MEKAALLKFCLTFLVMTFVNDTNVFSVTVNASGPSLHNLQDELTSPLKFDGSRGYATFELKKLFLR
jgi:hypothetical protein